MYSPAKGPDMVRTAPAKNRNTSTIAGISSPIAALIGLPKLSASSFPKASPSLSIRLAISNNAAERSPGVVCDHWPKASLAPATAASTCSLMPHAGPESALHYAY